MLSEELKELSAKAQGYITDLTYNVLILKLKGEAYQGKCHFETKVNLKDKTVNWKEIIKKLEEEGMKCDIDYYYGNDNERTLKISW